MKTNMKMKMKNWRVIFSVAVMMAFCLNLTAQGMTFSEDDWATLLKRAKVENKIIFVDAYTTWCGPCKMMSANVFPEKAVGTFYNAKFINAKIDMEDGEGVAIARKYEVNAYPTFLFINGDGELVHRGIGYRPSPAFLALGEAASNPNTQLRTLKKSYDAGERSGEFMTRYIEVLQDAGMDVAEVSNEYLESIIAYDSPEIMKFIYETTTVPSQKGFHIMVENKEGFYKQFGKEKVLERIDYSLQRVYFGNPEEMKAAYKKFMGAEAPRLSAKYDVAFQMFSRETDANEKFLTAAVVYLEEFGTENWEELNTMAWHVYEITEDKVLLEKACGWAEKSVKIKPSFYNLDTVATLYYALGEKKKAKKWAEQAIAAAEKVGEDASSTKELLEQINAM